MVRNAGFALRNESSFFPRLDAVENSTFDSSLSRINTEYLVRDTGQYGSDWY